MKISDCRLAIVGATGLVGEYLLKVLESRGLRPKQLALFASQRSAGKKITFADKEYAVSALKRDNIGDYDAAIFAAGGKISKDFAPVFAEKGCIVIDKSSAWRDDRDCPLVIPQINSDALVNIPKKIVASPNCSTTGLILALKPLIDAFGVPEHIVVATYQSVSGAGRAASDALERQRGGFTAPEPFAEMIFDNLIPAIGKIDGDGFFTEETKLIHESRKILNIKDLMISATAVRVPVEIGHSEAVTIFWNREIPVNKAIEALCEAPLMELKDIPTPRKAAGLESVAVGRIRKTPGKPGVLNLFLSFDNLLRGAASNAIDILEALPKD